MNKAFLEDLCAKIQLPEEDRELAFQEMERQPCLLYTSRISFWEAFSGIVTLVLVSLPIKASTSLIQESR